MRGDFLAVPSHLEFRTAGLGRWCRQTLYYDEMVTGSVPVASKVLPLSSCRGGGGVLNPHRSMDWLTLLPHLHVL